MAALDHALLGAWLTRWTVLAAPPGVVFRTPDELAGVLNDRRRDPETQALLVSPRCPGPPSCSTGWGTCWPGSASARAPRSSSSRRTNPRENSLNQTVLTTYPQRARSLARWRLRQSSGLPWSGARSGRVPATTASRCRQPPAPWGAAASV